jgi:hypothetical protein
MAIIKTSTGEEALTIIKNGLQTTNYVKNQNCTKRKLDELAIKVNSLISFLSGYSLIKDTSLDTNDEILNWTTPEVGADLCSSLWNLSSGFYKTSTLSQISGFEVAIVSLYFQILQNEYKGDEDNPDFKDWDRGDTPTPSWEITKPKLKQNQNVKDFENEYGYCPIQTAHEYFKYLCSIAHSRGAIPEGVGGIYSMSYKNDSNIGEFSEKQFERTSETLSNMISIVASTWTVIFPQIINEWEDSNSDPNFCKIENLFSTDHSLKVLEFSKRQAYTN